MITGYIYEKKFFNGFEPHVFKSYLHIKFIITDKKSYQDVVSEDNINYLISANLLTYEITIKQDTIACVYKYVSLYL